MEKISYQKTAYVKENLEFNISNLESVYLEGNTDTQNCSSYLGIFKVDIWTYVVEIINNVFPSINHSHFTVGYTGTYIKSFLEKNHSVREISKENFFKELDQVIHNWNIESVKENL